MAHFGGRSYLPEEREWSSISGLGFFNGFSIVQPVGALDGKAGLCQVTAEDCRGLVGDLRGFGNDRWALR